MQLIKPIGLMAVIVDEKLRVSETLDVDQIRIVSIVINTIQGFAQFILAFGGVDSAGRFHPDPRHAEDACNVAIQRSTQPEQFDQLFTDRPSGTVRTVFEPGFVDTLAEQVLLPTAYKLMWGAPNKYPDMEVQIAGRTVLGKKQTAVVEAGSIIRQ